MKDLHEGISEVRDLHALLDAMDEQDGIHMSADVIKEASDECWGENSGGDEHKEMLQREKMTKTDS